MKTTYDFIDENKRKTFLLLLLFPLVFAVLAYATIFLITPFITDMRAADGSTYHAGTVYYANYFSMYLIPALLGVAFIWILISYFSGDKMLLSAAGAREVDRSNNPELFNIVDTVAISAGLPTPRVYIMNDNSLNAFATGRDPQHASIALTTGIMKVLNRQETEAVVAHEMSHIGNRDIRLMLITVAGISFFALAGQIVLRAGRRAKKQAALVVFAAGIMLLVYGYLIAPLIRLALSRRREYQADATAALLTRNPAALASALEKISRDSRVENLDGKESMAAMCIANPLSKEGLFSRLSGFTATHPPIQDRIAVLRRMDNIH